MKRHLPAIGAIFATLTVPAHAQVEANICTFIETLAAHSASGYQDFRLRTDDPSYFLSSYEPPGVADEGCAILTDSPPVYFICDWFLRSEAEARQEWRAIAYDALACFPDIPPERKRIRDNLKQAELRSVISGNPVVVRIKAHGKVISISMSLDEDEY